jgi:hypothetical protein
MEKAILHLQKTIGERAISLQEMEELRKAVEGFSEDWFEYEEDREVYYLSPEVLDYRPKAKEDFEALGLGELEERIVDVLEQGKSVQWGRLALAMWVFFLFIVVYTVVQALF